MAGRLLDTRSAMQGCEGQGDCVRCGSTLIYKYQTRALLKCSACEYQWSDTAGTTYHAHKLPVETLDKIRSLYVGGMNARQISMELGINYRTAWARTREIDASQIEPEAPYDDHDD